MQTLRAYASIMAGLLTLGAAPAFAQTQILSMELPCYPADHAIGAYSREGYAPTDSGVQSDGDAWLLWRKGDAWLLTMSSGRMMCKVAHGDSWDVGRPVVPGRDG